MILSRADHWLSQLLYKCLFLSKSYNMSTLVSTELFNSCIYRCSVYNAFSIQLLLIHLLNLFKSWNIYFWHIWWFFFKSCNTSNHKCWFLCKSYVNSCFNSCKDIHAVYNVFYATLVNSSLELNLFRSWYTFFTHFLNFFLIMQYPKSLNYTTKISLHLWNSRGKTQPCTCVCRYTFKNF